MKKISILSVFYNCDRYLPDFFDNITSQSVFNQCELIFLRPDTSPGNEKIIAGAYRNKYPYNIRGVSTLYDPGLYELWNLGIELARGEYITNANPDDRRSSEHIARAVDFLDAHPEFDICATGIACTHDPNPSWDKSNRDANWFDDLEGEFTSVDLFKSDAKTGEIRSRNLPHCMPVWRKTLHQRFGYFNENKYGPSADWEFWLRVLSGGARGWMIGDILGLYYINQQSYWRSNSEAQLFDNLIVSEYFYAVEQKPQSDDYVKSIDVKCRLLNINDARKVQFGLHRHGWIEAIEALEPLHDENGIYLEPFIEKKFHFGTDPGDFNSSSPRGHDYPWVGFLHCTEDTPSWFSDWLKPSNIFQTKIWKESLPHCKGLFVLSTESKLWLTDWLKSNTNLEIQVDVILHPTNFDVPQFRWDIFSNRSRVVQVGFWLRKLNSIHFLQTDWPRIILRKSSSNLTFEEMVRFNFDIDSRFRQNVQFFDVVDNTTYDDILCSSVVLCNLYTAAANNTILECIARSTPVLVNRLPSTQEYLGKEYPLFFSDLTDASLHLKDICRVKAAHDYLREMDKKPLTYEYFLASVAKSQVYKNLSPKS